MPIGRVRFTLPRAVQVREPGDVKETHSAVHGTIAVYTDSMTETNSVIDNWEEIIHAMGEKINEIILRDKNAAV